MCLISADSGCMSLVLHAVVPISYKDSMEYQEKRRGDVCAEVLTWWADTMREQISKLSQPDDRVFNVMGCSGRCISE